MARLKIPHCVPRGALTTACDQLVSCRTQAVDPLVRKDLRKQKVSFAEVELALGLAQYTRRIGKHLFGGHPLVSSRIESALEQWRAVPGGPPNDFKGSR